MDQCRPSISAEATEERTNESRSLDLQPRNHSYRDPGSCLECTRTLTSTNTGLRRPCPLLALIRLYRRGLAGCSRDGDVMAAHGADRRSGISNHLSRLRFALGASVLHRHA